MLDINIRLLKAVKENQNFGSIQELIKCGADVNVKDNNGNTPLHFAQTKEIAENLIKYGANVNARNKQGETPLHITRDNDIAVVLFENYADVTIKDNKGRTPLNNDTVVEAWAYSYFGDPEDQIRNGVGDPFGVVEVEIF